MSPVEVLRHPDAADLAEAAAARLITTIVERQSAAGSASICLTGGRIGTAVLAAVAGSPACDAVDWSAVDIWWGDERYLPSGDPERNETGARTDLLDLVDVDPARVHPMPTPDQSGGDVDRAAEMYAQDLARATHPDDHGAAPSFDILMLGIGPDGHVASLFPEQPALHDTRSCTAVRGAPKPPPVRISLTFPSIEGAKEVWILASGEEKASAVRLALTAEAGRFQVPAAGARGRERTLFLLDESAASKLPSTMGRPSA
ncbi:MAG: 6-phosphogluconolactonase [Actinomycetes bacterium]